MHSPLRPCSIYRPRQEINSGEQLSLPTIVAIHAGLLLYEAAADKWTEYLSAGLWIYFLLLFLLFWIRSWHILTLWNIPSKFTLPPLLFVSFSVPEMICAFTPESRPAAFQTVKKKKRWTALKTKLWLILTPVETQRSNQCCSRDICAQDTHRHPQLLIITTVSCSKATEGDLRRNLCCFV